MKQLILLLIALAAATAINADGIDKNEASSHAKGVFRSQTNPTLVDVLQRADKNFKRSSGLHR